MVKKLGEIPLQYQPGAKWHYGVSTDVLGHLVERVSGQTLDAFFQKHIFQPLDMKDTAFFVPDNKKDPEARPQLANWVNWVRLR